MRENVLSTTQQMLELCDDNNDYLYIYITSVYEETIGTLSQFEKVEAAHCFEGNNYRTLFVQIIQVKG